MLKPALLPLFLALLANQAAPAEDWPNWRGPSFDGITEEKIPENLPDELPVIWRAKVGVGFSTVAVKGNRVLTMGNKDGVDTVWCLDAKTGDELWKHSYKCELDPRYYEGGPSATPTIDGDDVFTLSKKGHAYCLELESGDVRWKRDLVADHGFELPEWSFASSVYVDDDGEQILLNVGREGLALDRKTGKTKWKSGTETSGYATVVPFGRRQRLLFSAKSLLCLDFLEGTVKWEYPWKSSRDVNAADPIVVTTRRILVSSSRGAELLEIKRGEKEPQMVWENKNLKWYFNPGVLIGDHVYSISGTTHRPTELVCTDVKTGETVWAQEDFGSGALMATEKTLILFDKGELSLIEATPEEFKPIHQQRILEGKCWTAPVLANGVIYCRNAAGDLAAVAVGGKTAD